MIRFRNCNHSTTIVYFVKYYEQVFLPYNKSNIYIRNDFVYNYGQQMTDRLDGIRPLLQRIGLDENEAEVYLSLLPLKMARVTMISKAAKQSRTNTYLILRSLVSKGLASEIERGNIIHFLAESPSRLVELVEQREREMRDIKPLISSAVPFLSAMTGSLIGEPRVTMLKGLQGIRQTYRDLLSQDFVGIFNAQAMFDAFGKNIVADMFGKDRELHGRDLLVSNDGAKRYVREIGEQDGYDIRLLPDAMAFTCDMIIAGDTVALFAYDDEKTIVRIENANIAEAMRAWHAALWSLSSGPS